MVDKSDSTCEASTTATCRARFRDQLGQHLEAERVESAVGSSSNTRSGEWSRTCARPKRRSIRASNVRASSSRSRRPTIEQRLGPFTTRAPRHALQSAEQVERTAQRQLAQERRVFGR
jgi:hypothetical protein